MGRKESNQINKSNEMSMVFYFLNKGQISKLLFAATSVSAFGVICIIPHHNSHKNELTCLLLYSKLKHLEV